MILSLEELVRIRDSIPGTLVATSGGFDPLHGGHLRSLVAARSLGDALVVIANGDGYLKRKKGFVFMPAADRLEILDALKCVDFVVPFYDGTLVVCAAIEALRPQLFAKGVQVERPEDLPEWHACVSVGCRVVLGVGGPKSRSSSELAARAAQVLGAPPRSPPQGSLP